MKEILEMTVLKELKLILIYLYLKQCISVFETGGSMYILVLIKPSLINLERAQLINPAKIWITYQRRLRHSGDDSAMFPASYPPKIKIVDANYNRSISVFCSTFHIKMNWYIDFQLWKRDEIFFLHSEFFSLHSVNWKKNQKCPVIKLIRIDNPERLYGLLIRIANFSTYGLPDHEHPSMEELKQKMLRQIHHT